MAGKVGGDELTGARRRSGSGAIVGQALSLVAMAGAFRGGVVQGPLLLPASFVACLAVIAIVGWNLHLSRQSAERGAVQAAENLVGVTARDIESTIAVFDSYLRGLVATFSGEGPLAAPQPRREALLDLAVGLADLGAIVVLDADGRAVETAPPLQPSDAAATDLSQRDWFTNAVAEAGSDLYVGAPQQSLLGDGPVLPLSRRIEGPGGELRGVAMIELRVTFFERLVSGLELGREGVVWAGWANRTVIIRRPSLGDGGDTGADVSRSPNWKYVRAAPKGSYRATGAVDGIDRIYTFERVGDLPISVAVGTGLGEMFAEWRRRSFASLALTGVLCSILFGFAVLLRREIARRNLVEQELLLQSETDPLTGLANRRRFEGAFEIEIRRARRGRMPISVLMIDVDRFKLINDRFGHGYGDVVLTAIGECIRAAIRRPGDLAARVGGDEFAVLLPETGGEGARTVAEAARTAVERHAFPDPSGATITIGIATATELVALSSSDLIAAADRALYLAKEAGRNRVVCTAWSGR